MVLLEKARAIARWDRLSASTQVLRGDDLPLRSNA
jgi:hypothetical protein